MKTTFTRCLTLAGLTFSLQSCIFVAGAAAGAAAIAIVYDHRTFENSLQDTQVANKINHEFSKVADLHDECNIDVTSFNRVVLLTGQCPKPEWKQEAGQIAQSVPDVSRVYNQISIQGPTSALTRTSDSWITTKIKSLMLANDDLKSSSIKVVTQNGDVYLMGIVKQDQADIAVDIARQVSGVQKVVKIFQYKN